MLVNSTELFPGWYQFQLFLVKRSVWMSQPGPLRGFPRALCLEQIFNEEFNGHILEDIWPMSGNSLFFLSMNQGSSL